MSDNVYLARVRIKDRALLELGTDWKWTALEGEEFGDLDASLANLMSMGYRYSPAHGQRGARLASQVAEKLSGTVELPTVAQGEPGTVY